MTHPTTPDSRESPVNEFKLGKAIGRHQAIEECANVCARISDEYTGQSEFDSGGAFGAEKCAERLRALKPTVSTPLTPSDEMVEAAKALLDKLQEIDEHPSFKSVFTTASIHGVDYRGPTYSKELAALQAALNLTGGK